jgi:hypothetical protein
MHLTLRLSLLPGVLLLAGSPFVLAESPMPDPIPPAVMGRPFEPMQPTRPVREKPAAAKPATPNHTTTRPAAHAVPATPKHTTTRPAAHAVPAAPAAPTGQRAAKKAVDDRADPRMRVDDVGKGTHVARKPLGPGAYIGDRHRTAVRKYYATHPVSGAGANWKIGEPLPNGAPLAAVPKGLLASLPEVPPGHRYIQLGGEVVLIATGSNMVVDGVSRSTH